MVGQPPISRPISPAKCLGFVFGVAPAFLVIHLVRRSGEGVSVIGSHSIGHAFDLVRGAGLFLIVALGGIGMHLAAVELGVNRFVVPVPPLGFWWTGPALVLNASQAAIVEEVIVLGYLITRLQQLSWSPVAAVAASALLRGSYHLYQGAASSGTSRWVCSSASCSSGGEAHVAVRGRTRPAGYRRRGFILFRDRLPGF